MARSTNNVITHGLSGKFGDMVVFRQAAGQTIVGKAPSGRTGPPTEAQQEIRNKFQRAAIYGKAIKADPQKKETYADKAEPGESWYTVAVADFFNAPDIIEIDLSEYTGEPGQFIKIKVMDDFEVKAVTVRIANEDGSLQEEGNAVQTESIVDWLYTTTTNNTATTGDKITIIATDNPANLTTEERIL